MGKKISKRERKFNASGGVKARLEKGTITNKGRLKRKRRSNNPTDGGAKNNKNTKASQKALRQALDDKEERSNDDFITGKKNLGDLDIQSFFASFADAVGETKEEEDYEIMKDDESDGDEEEGDNDEEEEKDDEAAKKKKTKTKTEKTTTPPAKKKSSKAKKKQEESSSSSGDDDKSGGDGDDGSSDDDSDTDEDESDVEAAELRMKEQIQKLERSDPEFHEYLQENEQSLLDFGQEEEDEDEDDDDDAAGEEEEEEEDNDGQQQKAKEGQKTFDLKLLKTLEAAAFGSQHGIKSFKKLIRAYTSACHLADSGGSGDNNKGGNKNYYHIASSVVFDKLLVACLDRCHKEFYYHLLHNDEDEEKKDGDESLHHPPNQPLDPKTLEKAKRWKDVKPVLFAFLDSTHHLLSSEAKEPDLLLFVLDSLEPCVPYLSPFPRLAERFLKTFVQLWSAPISSAAKSDDDGDNNNYQAVRLKSFLRIRQLTLTQPFPFIEASLKKLYLAYARRAKFSIQQEAAAAANRENDDDRGSGAAGLSTLTFLGNCVVELYRLDYASSYQHAFVYIRQLALLLRTAMQKKTDESFQSVFCWQFLHCLKVWVAVLSSSASATDSLDNNGATTPSNEEETNNNENAAASQQHKALMRSLIFPLTEVVLGTIRLLPQPVKYLPMKFHCVRLLQQLAASTETYIPTATTILGVLDHKELYSGKQQRNKRKQSSSRSTVRGLQLPFLLKLPGNDPLRTNEEQDACVNELFLLLNREIDLYRFSPGFPEFSSFLCQRLRKFCKDTKNNKWRAFGRGCIDLCERYSNTIAQQRSTIKEAPKDIHRLEFFRRPNQPSMGDRHAAAIAKEKSELFPGESNATRTSTFGTKENEPVVEEEDDGDNDSDGNDDNDLEEADGSNEKSKKKKKKKRKSSSKSGEDDGGDSKTDKKPKKRKKTDVPARGGGSDDDDVEAVLQEKDTLREGVDWSDEE